MTAFYLQKGSIHAVPIIHYNMEMAAQVRLAIESLKPDCIAVELAETMQLQLLHAASRLPEISVVMTYDQKQEPLYYLSEPCDAAFEGLRTAIESKIPAFCIDLDVDYYPEIREQLPDPYAIQRIGLEKYYSIYRKITLAHGPKKSDQDLDREMHMARRLKELSLSYDKILFIGGMAHVENILELTVRKSFPVKEHAKRDRVEICTLTETSLREVLTEFGWVSKMYEESRTSHDFPPDRQKIIYQLYKDAAEKYKKNSNCEFPPYNLRNIMKFSRNYSLITHRLMPDLFQILTTAKGCVDHNYAYETWELATDYPYHKNVDGLFEMDLSIEQMWGHSKIIRFHFRQQSRKKNNFQRRKKDQSKNRFQPPGPFSICSYPPEDLTIEKFGTFLKKKGTQILSEDAARSVPFVTSLEDGLDTRETIRHWHEKKLYVKMWGKPPGGVGSIVVIFDEDSQKEEGAFEEKYTWKTTWIGEHEQESDMALYATPLASNVVGPGISRCEYGGFMMSYPPRRMYDIWSDPDYDEAKTKAEALLMAAIDYAVGPIVVYVAHKPPRSLIKNFAQRYGKKIVYMPIGQLSPTTLNKIRIFHVLDGHDRRDIADEYIH